MKFKRFILLNFLVKYNAKIMKFNELYKLLKNFFSALFYILRMHTFLTDIMRIFIIFFIMKKILLKKTPLNGMDYVAREFYNIYKT